MGDFVRRNAVDVFAELGALHTLQLRPLPSAPRCKLSPRPSFPFFSPSFHRARILRTNFREVARIPSAPSNWRFTEKSARYVGGFRRIVYEEIRVGAREKMNNLDGSREIRQFPAN